MDCLVSERLFEDTAGQPTLDRDVAELVGRPEHPFGKIAELERASAANRLGGKAFIIAERSNS